MLNLWQIKFPVYLFDTPNFVVEDKCTFCEDSKGALRLIDDRSMPGETLGLRRLQHQATYGAQAYKLYKLNKPLFTISDMVRQPSSKYIDSRGRIFNYTKKEYYLVHTYKLEKYVEFMEGYVLYPKGLHCRFFLGRAPDIDELYVQVLHVGMGFVLYDLAREHSPPFRRKI